MLMILDWRIKIFLLTRFQPMYHFYNLWKQQITSAFLFLGGIDGTLVKLL